MRNGIDDLQHLGDRLGAENQSVAPVRSRKLTGFGVLLFVVTSTNSKFLVTALLDGASVDLALASATLATRPKTRSVQFLRDQQDLVAI